jgi:hypothetical protein
MVRETEGERGDKGKEVNGEGYNARREIGLNQIRFLRDARELKLDVDGVDDVIANGGPDFQAKGAGGGTNIIPPQKGQLVIPEKPPVLPFVTSSSSALYLFIISGSFFAIMSETFQELADIPKDFIRDGSQFVRRCTKRMLIDSHDHANS